ncbi:Dihydroneopterin triphosphate pyrophosphatase protein [Marine Group I thaumarchaeote SCGC AAA799-E16]|uniref:Bis(5'-nucleosyl)-tetraphosphatase [asymmetrical] n=4 Tax=Marine Group I TaxID=905826 RepID=A0A081RNJ4_9ARCH|nr:Dihydroneopterin triphosphate pyrophosphatase protein [Marine Group I thaumarchaeote SCGC AAA799-N04]KER06299.1 Dihydroneopterin triphosphate pyrophosphatase protein [Marine Group I thaumarchaeote SCGC AAA799-E16]KFM15475.1 Dihydroneopterin triphosphate pyrophosphatase protein [Marine Group I thaumarchaeote SCGC AAA799-D11]KFM16717.1 RNA pyrophosphohydrolase protein [Marine Group I thaumarchaeote SCGC RSA3]
MIEETSAGIVLFRKEDSKNLFLLLHYPSGHWDFVKGKMEKGESTHETAIRETKEETGITDVKFLDDFEEWIEYNFQYQKELVHKKVVFFLAETTTKEVNISHEHLDYTWMDYNTAMEKTTFDNAKTVLTKAQMLLTKTV